jgi:hypothetical protein
MRRSWLGDIPNQPVRYRLVDPFKERTVAYLLFEEDSPLEPQKYLGQFVGVYGQRVTDHPEWLVDVFEAEELVELPPPVVPGDVSEPIMKPRPQPAPSTLMPIEESSAPAPTAAPASPPIAEEQPESMESMTPVE